MKRIECPNCETQYTIKRMGLPTPIVSQISTVICSVCGESYDITFSKNLFTRRLKAHTILR